MNSQTPRSTLLYPGTSDWETWVVGDKSGTWKPSSRKQDGMEAAHLAIPVRALCSVPLKVNPGDPEVLKGIIRVLLEGRGISLPDQGRTTISYSTVQENPDAVQILATALQSQGLNWVQFPAREFEISAHFQPLPENGIVIWRELGHWNVLFTRSGKIAHFQSLSQTTLNQEAYREILAIQEGLILQDFIDPPTSIEVLNHPDVSPDDLKSFREGFPITVQTQTVETLKSPIEKSHLIPPEVASARQTRQRRQRLVWGMAAILGIYLAFIAAWFFRLEGNEREIGQMREQVTQLEPKARLVREARIEAERLRPAFDFELFPLELFNHCVRLLPEEGVKLTYFEAGTGVVSLRGEASNSTAAVTWKARLLSSEAFREYRWDFPQPEILPDNRALFTATGTLPIWTP